MIVTLPFSADFSDGTIHAWGGGGGIIAAVSGKPFSHAMQWSQRDVVTAPANVAAGTSVSISGWLNAAGLASHPSDGNSYTVVLGIVSLNASGVQNFISAGTINPGVSWTFISGTVTVPADSVSISGWLSIQAINPLAGGLYAQAAVLTFQPLPAGASIIALPTRPGFRTADFTMSDSIGVVQSPYTLSTQTQEWAGGDEWGVTLTLPPMNVKDAAAWIAFLAELRGQLNVFQIGDPEACTLPPGQVRGIPLVDGSTPTNNATATQVLFTKGWTASQYRLLLPRDYIQIGYRLHMVLDPVNSDANGNAQFRIWPSLREQPADGSSIILRSPVGLFRLADNTRKFTSSYLRSAPISFQAIEAR